MDAKVSKENFKEKGSSSIVPTGSSSKKEKEG